MAILTPQTIPVDGGLTPATVAAAAGGDEAPTGNNRLLYASNTSAGAITITVATPGTVKGLAVAESSASVAAGAVWLVPLTDVFRDPSTGRANVTYSGTGLQVAVLEPER